MLKTVLIGVWIAAVTAGATYLSATMQLSASGTGASTESHGLEEIATDMISVPMIRGGAIIGYVILQLSFEADRTLLEELKIEPKPFLVDAAFRSVYSNTESDFTKLKAGDIDALTETIAKEANKRIGGELVKQVLIQQLNYVRKEDIRTHWIKDKTE
jgi:hypothetical protein